MARRVFLHVGTPKSGTTYLQSLLFANREALLERGVLYPGERPFDQNRASLDVRNGRHLGGDREARSWDRMLAQLGDFDGDAVLSNEWYAEATDDQVAGAVEQLGADRVHVLVTTRSQVRLVPAAWQESLKIGRGHSMADFVSKLEVGEDTWSWRVLDPAHVAGRWGGVVGPGRTHVITVPDNPEPRDLLWRRFAEAVGFRTDGLDPSPPAANESLSVQAARLLQDFGPALRAEVDRHAQGWQAPFRWLRIGVAHEILAGLPGDPIGIDDDLRQELHRRSVAAVAGLRELGVVVHGDLEELLHVSERPGARLPAEVTDAELVEAARALSVGLLGARLRDQTRHRSRADRRGTGPDTEPEATPSAAARVAERTRGAARSAVAGAREGRRRLAARLARRSRTRRITFMVPFAYGMGGIPRTVFMVANALAERGYDVSVVTLVRTAETPYFSLHPRVRLVALDDRFDPARPGRERPRPRRDPQRPQHERRLDRKPSQLVEGAHASFSAYVDQQLRSHLESLPPGVIVSTRPEFTIAATRWADPESLVVHQEHLSFVGRAKALRQGCRDLALRSGVPRPADAFLTLTDADLARWQEFVGASPTRWGVIPNATPFGVGEPAPLTSRIVLAAGRFTRQKGFDRLLAAYAPLAESHPDWQLHLYGDGDLDGELHEQLRDLDVGDRIQIRGFTSEFEQVLENASVYAMSSRFEGLPMVLLEAFSKGVPPVSFDCPEGPRQLIESGVNGLLVPEGDVPALTEALRQVMDDESLRRKLGAGALSSARDYQLDPVVDRWVALFEELDARRQAGRG